MADRQQKQAAIVDAAFRLAATRAWTDVRLSDIAAEAGVGLADLAELVDGKADILHIYGRQLDIRMLRSPPWRSSRGDSVLVPTNTLPWLTVTLP